MSRATPTPAHQGSSLQIKLALSTLAGFVVTGGIALAALTMDMRYHNQRLERADALRGIDRMLRTLEGQLDTFRDVALEWSNWDEVYRFAQGRQPDFVAQNMYPETLTTSKLPYLVMDDRERHRIASHDADGIGPDIDALRDARGYRPAPDAPGACGFALVPARSDLLMTCDLPIHRGDGSGEAAGRLTTARWLDGKARQRMFAQTQLTFDIVPAQHMGKHGTPLAPQQFQGRTVVPYLATNDDSIHIEVPIPSAVDAQTDIGVLRLTMPRTLSALANQRLATSAVLLTTAILLATLLTLLLANRIVVRRLNRLRSQVEAVAADAAWKQRVEVVGGDEVDALGAQINLLLDTIAQQTVALQTLAHTDTLTGLANRRLFMERLDLALKRRARNERAGVALALVDVDFFKRYNDTYGHPAGDVVLATVADCLRAAATRGTDLAARVGGEEFALLLEVDSRGGAQACVTRFFDALAARQVPHGASPHGIVSASVGVALAQSGEVADAMYARADQLLYRAKEAGRAQAAYDA